MTWIITDPIFKKHDTGFGHPEAPERVDSILFALKNHKMIEPLDATVEDLLLCHTQEYINKVRHDIESGFSMLSTGDVMISPESYVVALRAVGAVLKGVDLVLQNETKEVFCVVRPPGHHACSNQGMGFCIFNNIAIGARYAQKKYGIKKVIIVDFDVHHGNGTQEIFYNDPSVYYFSTHQYPLYPGTGAPNEIGARNICNIPIAATEEARKKVLDTYNHTFKEKMSLFKPELVMVSAGFDAHKNDPLGGLNLETEDFVTIMQSIREVAVKYAEGRIVSVLEGGYNLEALSACAKAIF